MYPLGCGMPDWYLSRPERELCDKLWAVEDRLARCPVCNGHIRMEVVREQHGMDGGYYDWLFRCKSCGMSVRMSADNFYGRTYSSFEEAVDKWNNRSWFKEEKHDENAR